MLALKLRPTMKRAEVLRIAKARIEGVIHNMRRAEPVLFVEDQKSYLAAVIGNGEIIQGVVGYQEWEDFFCLAAEFKMIFAAK